MTPGPISTLLRILVVFLTVLFAVALAERAAGVLQKRYRAAVAMQVEGPSFGAPSPSSETITAIVTSPAALAPVLRSLGKDASDDALRKLQRSVKVREIRNTELFQIDVTDTNPIDAANLANAIAEEVARQLVAEQQAAIAMSLATFEEKIAALRKSVAGLQAEFEQARVESGIIDFWPDSNGLVPLAEALPKLKAQIAEAKTLQEKLAGLTDAELLAEFAQSTPFGVSLDSTMLDLSLKVQQAREEEKQAASATSNGHLQEVRERISRLEKQLFNLIPVLRARVANTSKALESVLRISEQAAPQQPGKDAAEKYHRAKTRYLEEKQRLEDLEIKRALESLQTGAHPVPAKIWEKAGPPARAEVAPYLMLALTLLLGLALGVGLAFLERPGVTVLVLIVLLLAVLASFRYPARVGIKPPTLPPSPPSTPYVSVKGAVLHPRFVPFPGRLTLSEALTAAGGFTKYSDQRKVRLRHQGRQMVIDMDAIRRNPAKDIPLESGDDVEVPEAIW